MNKMDEWKKELHPDQGDQAAPDPATPQDSVPIYAAETPAAFDGPPITGNTDETPQMNLPPHMVVGVDDTVVSEIPPPPIDKEKAQSRIKRLVNQPGLRRDDISPAETIAGAIIDNKYGEEIQEQLHTFRIKIDSLYLTAKWISEQAPIIGLYGGKSQELSLAITAFQNARQWVGKMLQERGAVKPYTKDSTQQVDKGVEIGFVIKHIDESSALYALRDFAEDLITDLTIFCESTPSVSLLENISRDKALGGVVDGKMWCGERIGVLKS